MDFPDAEFDAVVGVSVFTHLPNQLQDIWLAELRRVTKPGGVLILSVHSEDFAKSRLSSSQFADLEANGIHYLVHATGIAKLDGLPDYYQVTFHTQAHIESQWSKHFEIVDYVKHGIGAIQDAVILRRV